MGFLDYVLAGFGVHSVKDSTPEKVAEVKNRTVLQKKTLPSIRSTPKRITPIGQKANKLAIFCPSDMEEVIEVVKFLRTQQPAMLNITMMAEELAQRSMDFILGAITAVEASMECVGKGLYLFAPKGTRMINKTKEEYE